MRIDAGHDLAIKLEHKAEHPMRGRMLWPEIDGEVTQCCCFGHGQTFGPAFSSPGRTG